MPRASVLQESFNAGEFSPLVQGRVQQPRYKEGLAICLNYLPTLQGPLVRRPGTKFMNAVKDSTKPPVLIPFEFSVTQAYMLEFGDQYIRFYANNGQIITSGTSYQVFGRTSNGYYTYHATQASTAPNGNQEVSSSTAVTSGSVLELVSPYAYADVANLRYAQTQDTLYLFHPNYPIHKLQRYGQTYWQISQVYLSDGPYLALNSYESTGDSTAITLTAQGAGTSAPFNVQAGPTAAISGAANNGSGLIRITATAHGYQTGQKVYISGVGGTTEANNTTWGSYWVITVVDANTFDLIGSTFVHAYVSGGTAAPAIFMVSGAGGLVTNDNERSISLQYSGQRYFGFIVGLNNPSSVSVQLDPTSHVIPSGSVNTAAEAWQLGVYSPFNGFPATGCFHQQRLVLAGCPNYPQQIDGSETGNFESFQPNDPTNIKASDSNAFQFPLVSQDVNAIRWVKANAQGLLAGTYTAEWMLAASTQSVALTPSNVNAVQTSTFGSANIDAVQSGNAILYVQRAQRKLRELNYFWQVATFRSTDLTELSEHITLPTITRLASQKETQPIIWAIRSDGALLSLIYSRDDTNLRAGWSRHFLGGQSDSGGTPPVVTSIAVIPSPDISFDQLWMVVKRYINGATIYAIEYMTKINDDSILQEDAFQFDCGATYDSPITITGITNASTAVVTAAAHGLPNGTQIRIVNVVGLNQTTTDQYSNTTITNLVNEKTFVVAGVTTNTFQLNDFNGNPISSSAYSAYVSGGQVRKLVTTISGLTWLENETVSVLADGAIHPNVTVSNTGSITLNYPAAKVQIGYGYNSDGQLLRSEAGAADGTSIGKIKHVSRVAAMLHRVGDFLMGMSFTNLFPAKFIQADQQQADQATSLWSGIHRDGVESTYDFDQQFCFRQSSGLPGTIQAITTIVEEDDV